MPNFFIIPLGQLPSFIESIAANEEIRPVQSTVPGQGVGKFMLQADLASSGPKYASIAAQAKYTALIKYDHNGNVVP